MFTAQFALKFAQIMRKIIDTALKVSRTYEFASVSKWYEILF